MVQRVPPHTVDVSPINFSTVRLITFPPGGPRFICCRLFWAPSHLDSSQLSHHIPSLSLNVSSHCAYKLTGRGGGWTGGSNGKTAKNVGLFIISLLIYSLSPATLFWRPSCRRSTAPGTLSCGSWGGGAGCAALWKFSHTACTRTSSPSCAPAQKTADQGLKNEEEIVFSIVCACAENSRSRSQKRKKK